MLASIHWHLDDEYPEEINDRLNVEKVFQHTAPPRRRVWTTKEFPCAQAICRQV